MTSVKKNKTEVLDLKNYSLKQCTQWMSLKQFKQNTEENLKNWDTIQNDACREKGYEIWRINKKHR